MQLEQISSSLALNHQVDGIYGKFFFHDASHSGNSSTISSVTMNSESRFTKESHITTTPFAQSDNGANQLVSPTVAPFFPSIVKDHCTDTSDMFVSGEVRIFCEMYGILGNLTKMFAERLDNYQLKCNRDCQKCGFCIGRIGALQKVYNKVVLREIMKEDHFWEDIEKYPWTKPMHEKLYRMCRGRLFYLQDWFDGEQLTERMMWTRRHFGDKAGCNLIMTASKNRVLLPNGKKDVLIDNDMYAIERWLAAGGSAFYWPELLGECVNQNKIISRRLYLLECVISALNDAKALI